MNAEFGMQLATGLLALVIEIIDKCRLDNDELARRVEEGVGRESETGKALAAYLKTYGSGPPERPR